VTVARPGGWGAGRDAAYEDQAVSSSALRRLIRQLGGRNNFHCNVSQQNGKLPAKSGNLKIENFELNPRSLREIRRLPAAKYWRKSEVSRTGNIRAVLTTAVIGLAAHTLSAEPALATIWTDWTSARAGSPGSAVGTLNGITVTYNGEVISRTVTDGTFTGWVPDSSFVDGTVVTSSPREVGDIIGLGGDHTGTNTITFASPIIDPVMAIWSLGSPSVLSSFDSLSTTPTFVVGGPNGNYGGAAIIVSGNTVSGQEGNGVVQFAGTISSISWTSSPELWYGFTVGAPDLAPRLAPEPSSLVLLGSMIGLCLLGRIWKSV
jgi:hypothetical protein